MYWRTRTKMQVQKVSLAQVSVSKDVENAKNWFSEQDTKPKIGLDPGSTDLVSLSFPFMEIDMDESRRKNVGIRRGAPTGPKWSRISIF